jgi:hypothetical protein
VIRVIKVFQKLIEDKPLEFEKRFLYVTLDIIKERVDEVKKFGACAVGSRHNDIIEFPDGQWLIGTKTSKINLTLSKY